MKYPHSESLKKNRDFQLLYKEGKSRANRYLVLYVKENGLEKNRLGVSVSKKVGNSIVRFNSGLDMVVIARVSAKDRSMREIESALLHLGKLQGVLKEE